MKQLPKVDAASGPACNPGLRMTRRHFFGRAAGIGTLALHALLNPEAWAAAPARRREPGPLSPRLSHFAPKAKRVIFLFMYGGPSQLDLFDYKPVLQAQSGKPVPESFIRGQRFAFLRGVPNLLGTPFRFSRSGQSGAELSELLPHTASVADRLAIIRSVHTDAFNHDPATTFFNTGSTQSGRPAMGSWLTYGLGSEASDLPGFVVLVSGTGSQPLGAHHWGSGFLPSVYQGVQFRSQGDPVLAVSNPPGVDAELRRETVQAIGDLNRMQLARVGDPEIETRIHAYEMAYRMQMSVPGLMDIEKEPESVRALYGAVPGKPSFAANCLLARRLVEKGVRFVQLFHRSWDHHGNTGDSNILKGLPQLCEETDQPAAALVKDLEQRGLLEDTLVIWGGEFGRTPMLQGVADDKLMGRDHHPNAFTIWMAGAGIRPGLQLGATDEFGYRPVEDPVHVHDVQATVLHLFGLDHTRLTYRFQGREFRLTDVAGEVVHKLLA